MKMPINMAAQASPIIGKAVKRYKVLSADEKAQEMEAKRIRDEWYTQDLINTRLAEAERETKDKILKLLDSGVSRAELKAMLQ
jgi:hypothetical protein